MTIDTSILEDIGLTNAQIKTYLALLELSETTTGPVIKKSGLQNSVVYNALSQLIEHGLVTFVLKGKRKYFSATSPKNLVKYVGDKKRAMGNIAEPINYQHPNFTHLFDFSPFKYEDCKDCNILPICMGGCPARRADRELPGVWQCETWKHNLPPMLEIIARSRQQQPRPAGKE